MRVRTPGLCSYRQINGGEKKYPEPKAVLPLLEVGGKENNIQHPSQPWRNLVLSSQSPGFTELVRKRGKSALPASFSLSRYKDTHLTLHAGRRAARGSAVEKDKLSLLAAPACGARHVAHLQSPWIQELEKRGLSACSHGR